MTTFPRVGFQRVGEQPRRVRTRDRYRGRCRSSAKIRHPTESDALAALMRVREERITNREDRVPENRIYFCDDCEGWHLSSRELDPYLLNTVPPRGDGEPWDVYTRRLEKKIATQRSEITSLLALGHGGGNRELRKRIPALLKALARTSERCEAERIHRENLVAILQQRHPLCWLVWRMTFGRTT